VGTTTREHAQAAESEARAIAVAVDERLDRVGRIRRRLDPRHLVGTPGSRHRVGR
jgi:hypothetical protein